MNLILVDTSYTIFYRIFATLKWYSFAFKEEYNNFLKNDKYDWFTNKIFMDKYEKMFLESIIKCIKKKIFINSQIFFCIDSPKNKLWRTKLQNDYKSERLNLISKHHLELIFNYTFKNILPNLVQKYENIKMISINGIEADDIIACICIYHNKDNTIIYIISGDSDFLQLGRKNIYFVNYKTKKPITISKDDANNILNKKIILGDKSDNIPSIFPKHFKINKKELLESSEKLTEFLNNNPDIKIKYLHNSKMIDFNYIPKKYFNSIIKKYLT